MDILIEMSAVDHRQTGNPTAHREVTKIFVSSPPLPHNLMLTKHGEQTMTGVCHISHPAATVVVGVAVVAEVPVGEEKPEVPAAVARDRDHHRALRRNTLPTGTNIKALRNGSSDRNMAAIILRDPPAIATPAALRLHHTLHLTATTIIRTILNTLTTHITTITIPLLHTLLAWAIFHHGPTAAHLEVSTLRHPQVTLSATVHLSMAWSTMSWEETLHKGVRWRLAARRPGPSRFAILKGC